MTKASFQMSNGYPAWEYDANSKVKDIALNVYKKVTGKDAKIEAIHPDVDMISIGPDIKDVHTPAEHLSISSVDRMWRFLKELVISIA